MLKKININKHMHEHHRQLLNSIEHEKDESFMLIWLLSILFLIELLLDFLLNINTFTFVMLTFIISLFINTYIIYKLSKTKELMSIVFTAHYNNLEITQLFKLSTRENKDINILNLSWKLFISDYFIVFMSYLSCIISVFLSYTQHFL